jgi:AcrR family transcriptional regulator
MPRPSNPGAHEALLDAARVEFARRGIERARVEDVARRAGVSKGAFYLHFRSKEDAFREILQRFLGALEDVARRRQETEERVQREASGDVGARLDVECACDVELLELLWRNRQILAIVDGANGRAYARTVGEFRRRMRATITSRLAERQRRGELPAEADAALLGDVILGSYEAFGRRMLDVDEKPDLEAWARAFLVLVYAGVAAIAGAPQPTAAR